VDPELGVVEWKPRRSGGLLSAFTAGGEGLARLLGLPDYAGDIIRELGADRIFLDGLLSVWQPEKPR
jgi:protease IV